jgi:drug/metabolite transporter (DMT)-like permease
VHVTELLLLCMALIWGINFSVVKYGTEVISPLAFNAMRVGLAAVFLGLLAVPRTDRPPRRDIVMLVLLGVLGNGAYQMLFIEGVARTRAGDAALVIAATPAFVALIGRVRGTERVSPRGAIGIALSMLGIGLVVFGNAAARAGESSVLGNSLVLAAAFCWSFYTVLSRPYTARVDGIQLSAYTMVGGAVPLLLIGLPAMIATPWREVSATAWGAVLYSGIGSMVVAYLIWYRGVRVLGPTRTAMFGNLQPLFALVVAWLALGEALTLWQGVGAASIMSGLLLTRSGAQSL